MTRHYPHRAANENNQSLHYNGFSPNSPVGVEQKQSLARREIREIGNSRGESAKLG
jgi:hypothetical protein